jgi:hypothetical protein
MGAIGIGNSTAKIVSVETVFDPNLGEQQIENWEGSEEALISIARNTVIPSGGKCRVSQGDGPIYRMAVSYGEVQSGGTTETPIDRWERVTEYIQEDLRQNPNVIAAAGTAKTLNKWVQDVKAALRANLELSEFYATEDDPNPTIADEQNLLYELYSRGTEAHEIKRFVLRLRRTISVNFVGRSVADPIEKVYITPTLISLFNVPPEVAGTLPANPPTSPAHTAWAWKQRQDNSVFLPGLNKIEESKDWVFAAWSTFLYILV